MQIQIAGLQKTLRACKVTGLGSALDIEPAKKTPQVDFDRMLADVQCVGYVTITLTFVQ